MEKPEHLKVDPPFCDRVDAHIYLSNSQMSDINAGKVSASRDVCDGAVGVGGRTARPPVFGWKERSATPGRAVRAPLD